MCPVGERIPQQHRDQNQRRQHTKGQPLWAHISEDNAIDDKQTRVVECQLDDVCACDTATSTEPNEPLVWHQYGTPDYPQGSVSVHVDVRIVIGVVCMAVV